MANVLWTQGLGMMHLARIRVGVRAVGGRTCRSSSPISSESVVDSCVFSALALAGASRP